MRQLLHFWGMTPLAHLHYIALIGGKEEGVCSGGATTAHTFLS